MPFKVGDRVRIPSMSQRGTVKAESGGRFWIERDGSWDGPILCDAHELVPTHEVRTFETGATRSQDSGRDDPEGFLSPLALDRFCQYMSAHRKQPDGSLRASDNWQKGLPLETYAKGMFRHFLHFWTRHRGWKVRDPLAAPDIQEDLCALLFNVQGYLHVLLEKEQGKGAQG